MIDMLREKTDAVVLSLSIVASTLYLD